MTAVLLFSGGLDSFIYWRLLDYPPLLYFQLGHRYQQAEMYSFDALQAALRAREMPFSLTITDRLYMGDLERDDAFIPFRNPLFFMVAAAMFPEADRLYLGALRGESSRDKSRAFFRRMSGLVSYTAGRRIAIAAPFHHWTKTRLVAEYVKRWPDDIDLLRLTTSCYHAAPGDTGCGQCMACFRRWVAMTLNGIDEPYHHPPAQWDQVQTTAWPQWWRYLCRAVPSEWLPIAHNNFLAWQALRGTHDD